mgnify:CR=1 FL=1
MAFTELIRAFEEAKRRASARGMPVSREEAMAALAPVYSGMARANIADQGTALGREGLALDREKLARQSEQFGQTLSANREIFDQGIALENWRRGLEEDARSSARPIQYLNVGLSGLGNLGMNLYTMKKDAENQRRLKELIDLYKR